MPLPLLGALAKPLIGLGATAIGSLLNRNKGNITKQQQTGTTSSTSTIGPTELGAEYQGLQGAIMPMIMKRLLNPGGVPRGFAEKSISGINRTYDMGKQSLANNITARGLGGSPIAGAADTRLEMGRLGDIADFQSSLPMLGRQMQNEDIGLGMNALEFGRSLAGRTQTNTGTNTMTGQTNAAGGGSLIGDMSSMLGWMIGNGAFDGAKKNPLAGTINGGVINKQFPSSLPALPMINGGIIDPRFPG